MSSKSEVLNWKYSRFLKNNKYNFNNNDILNVLPKHALRGEKLKLRLNLMNAGGDIVRDILTKVQYFNVKQPMRKSVIAMPSVHLMAPGEITTFDLEYILPEDQLLGKYQIIATVDPDNQIEELKEKNNTAKSNVIKPVSYTHLTLPTKA